MAVRGCNVMNEIRPGLWLGSAVAARDQKLLKSHGITHVLTLGHALPRNLRATGGGSSSCEKGAKRLRLHSSLVDPFERLVVPVTDTSAEVISQHFAACSAFTSAAIPCGGVLVHCNTGVSRGGTIVAQHLMRTEQLSAAAALASIREQRSDVEPNHGFLKQLQAFAKSLSCTKPLLTSPSMASMSTAASSGEDSTSETSSNSPQLSPRSSRVSERGLQWWTSSMPLVDVAKPLQS